MLRFRRHSYGDDNVDEEGRRRRRKTGIDAASDTRCYDLNSGELL